MRVVPSIAATLVIMGGALAQTGTVESIPILNGSGRMIASGSAIGTNSTIQLPSVASNVIYLYHPLSLGASPPPAGSYFHQVVDKYFDISGNEIEIRSATHVVNGDCTSGRRQQDLIAQDNGRGGVQFAQMLMPNEPTQGQKSVTAADKVKVLLAANKAIAADSTIELAENQK